MRASVVALVLSLCGCGSREAPVATLVTPASAAPSATSATSAAVLSSSTPDAALPEIPIEPTAVCVPAACTYDSVAKHCTSESPPRAPSASGATCRCTYDGTACVVHAYVGKVACVRSSDCSCTSEYRPAPAALFPLRKRDRAATSVVGDRPGDCVSLCRSGRCEAMQAPM